MSVRYYCDFCDEESEDVIIHECEVDIKIQELKENNHFVIPKFHLCYNCLDVFRKRAKAIGMILTHTFIEKNKQRPETE